MPSRIQIPSLFAKEVYVDSAVTINTSTNPVAPKKCLSYGHIAAILFDFTLAITIGTGVVSAVPAQNAINSITIRDKDNKEILKCNGSQLSRMRKLATLQSSLGMDEYRKGEYDAGTNIASTGGNYRVEIPINIPLSYQPITIEYTMGVLADFLGTVGTATATGTLRIATKSYSQSLTDEQREIAKLVRYQAYTYPSLNGEDSFQQRLMDSMWIERLMIDLTADSNATDFTFKSGGIVGFDKLSERYVQMWENRAFDDGHTPTGLYVLPVTGTVVTNATEFRINTAGAIAPVAYFAYRLPNELGN